jgi:ribonuclease VapC
VKKPKAIVLDSWAVMAYLEDESSAEKVGEVLTSSQEDGTPLLMCVVNAGEVWYTLARRRSIKDADETLTWLREIGVRVIDVDWALTKLAANFKLKGNISYADYYAAALAKQSKAGLLTGDQEFRHLGDEINILFL